MNPIPFVSAVAGGIILAAAGAGMQFGSGVGLMVAGALSIVSGFATAVLVVWSAA